jgi:hypothetical protein
VRDPAQPVQQRYKDPRPHAADTPGGMVMSILHSASGDFEDETKPPPESWLTAPMTVGCELADRANP